MRFEVPQFIEIEDKIFGPFTWRQFVYLAGGLGIAVVTFITLPTIIWVLTGFPIGGMAFVLAFVPVNNRPFTIFLESVFKFYNSHRTYHWKRNTDLVYRNAPVSPASERLSKFTNTEVGNDINTLSRKLELNALQKDHEFSKE